MRWPTKTRRERDFLLDRTLNGDWTFVGRSSDELVRVAFEGGDAREHHYPLDHGDLRRCEQTYQRAPRHLKWRMRPTLRKFREHVYNRKGPAV